MKFQKSLLAAALAVVGFGVQAADATGKANIYAYQNVKGDEAYRVEVVSGNQTLVKSGWYTRGSAGQLVGLSANDVAQYENNLISGGQFDIKTSENTEVNVVEVIGGGTGSGTNVDQNNYWSFENSTTTTITTTTTGENQYVLDGQLVNYDQNGQTTDIERDFGFAETITLQPIEVKETTAATVKKDIQIGNLTEEQRTANAQYDFDLKSSSSNVQGLVSTIKTSEKPNTAVAAVTGNGLAVLDVPAGGLVDLEKGTVTFITNEGEQKTSPRAELVSYKTADNKNVVEYGGKYYTLDVASKSLTTYTGSAESLQLIGAGTVEQTAGGTQVKSVNTGLVSNQNVTYGESITKSTNEGIVKVASTDPANANEISGSDYIVNQSAQTVTSKDVVTGIIKTDDKGNKTYGLQATNVVDNKVTAQTTVTAEGIKTTGDITFVDAETQKETSVKGYLAETSKAVDAKIDSALVEVDSRLQQFNTTAARLNSRIDDVEKTSYRGIAIALAAQQQIPNIAAGQTAVFGGVGHYEGESAAALGLATVLADGRTSLSAALGVAGGSEVGGRVGVAYVFGGK